MEDSECRDFIVHDDGSVIDYYVSEVDAKNIADGCIDDWRDAAADSDGWSEEVENTFVALVTHRSVMINDRDATEEDYVGPDCTRVCDYELQPTAEWSRIQQALKERDELKLDLDLVNGQAEEFTKIIEKMSAELERVKAERDAYRTCLIEAGAIYEDTPPMDQFAAEVIGGAIKIEHDQLTSLKSHVKSELEWIVCTEGEDAGVFFLSPESESKYDPNLNCHVYQHEHFSELGDALIGLWKLVSPEPSQEGSSQKAGCDHCTDPDGVCCYPTYGMAPHMHDMNKTGSAIGSTVFLPRSEWPDNFDPDPDAEGCGTWTHCPKCGAPDHQDLFEKGKGDAE